MRALFTAYLAANVIHNIRIPCVESVARAGVAAGTSVTVMTRYLHEHPRWPELEFDGTRLAPVLASVHRRIGALRGRIESLGLASRSEAMLRALTDEVVMSSAVEDESLDRDQVRSSIARRLGLDIAGLVPSDRNVDEVVEMTLDATQRFAEPLTERRLLSWHAALFPSAQGRGAIRVGTYRVASSGPMRVVSGPLGRETVHFEAPHASALRPAMRAFVTWFESNPSLDPMVFAGLAHLRFLTIHPFDDGNGRIGRALVELALARAEQSSARFYSVSSRIREDRKAYYEILERTQRGPLDVTPWLEWFVACVDRAVARSERALEGVFATARFWDAHADVQFNDRQRTVVRRLLDGFEGKLTTSKWAKLTKTSQDTALRDIEDLVQQGVLVKDSAGGRSTSYSLATRAVR